MNHTSIQLLSTDLSINICQTNWKEMDQWKKSIIDTIVTAKYVSYVYHLY